jgi:hypothetical protein
VLRISGILHRIECRLLAKFCRLSCHRGTAALE